MSQVIDAMANGIGLMTYPYRRIVRGKSSIKKFSDLPPELYQNIQRPELPERIFQVEDNVPIEQFYSELKAQHQMQTQQIQETRGQAKDRDNEEEIIATCNEWQQALDNALKQAAVDLEKEIDRVIYLAHLTQQQKNKLQHIKDLATAKVSDVKQRNKYFITTTGNQVTITETGYEFNLPNRFFNAGYYQDELNHLTADLMSIAQHLKADGNQEIHFDITCQDSDQANRLAKKAYEAARCVGFFEDKIEIKINQEVISIDTLFEKDPDLKNWIDSQAKAYRQKKLEPFALDFIEPPVIKKPIEKKEKEKPAEAEITPSQAFCP